MVICFFSRRRLGAYLDGALDVAAARGMEGHLATCARCQREAAALRRLGALLHQAREASIEPDWTGFWPGIVRGIQDGGRAEVVLSRRPWSRRWALGGTAVAAATALSLVVWYGNWNNRASGPEESVVVTSANSQYPGGTMVYHTPDKVAVVWVFDE